MRFGDGVQRSFNLRGRSIPTPEPRPSNPHTCHPSNPPTPTRYGTVSVASASQQPPALHDLYAYNNATGIDEKLQSNTSITHSEQPRQLIQYQPSNFYPVPPQQSPLPSSSQPSFQPSDLTPSIQQPSKHSATTIKSSEQFPVTSLEVPTPRYDNAHDNTQLDMLTTSLDDLAMRVIALDENHNKFVTFQNDTNNRFSRIETLLEKVLQAVDTSKHTAPTTTPAITPAIQSAPQPRNLSQTPHTANLSTNPIQTNTPSIQNHITSPDYLGGIPNDYRLFTNIDPNNSAPSINPKHPASHLHFSYSQQNSTNPTNHPPQQVNQSIQSQNVITAHQNNAPTSVPSNSTIAPYNNLPPYASSVPNPYTPTSIFSMPFSRKDLNLTFPKYKDSDPYLVWKAQCLMKAQAYHNLPHLVETVNNKVQFNQAMDFIHSNVLKMATVDAYSVKKVYNLFSHSELPIISGTAIWDALDKAELRPSGQTPSTLSTVALMSLKDQLRSTKKNNTETIMNYHRRFST
mmetsp:Transcript_19829/g.27888  ORF Transcript_19829/g.27888 Transcript_19829/m.27888 type:complete len:515 (+) Transcript_19829:119-1663(+)